MVILRADKGNVTVMLDSKTVIVVRTSKALDATIYILKVLKESWAS